MNPRICRGAVWGLFVLSFLGLSMEARGQWPLPPPRRFVENLDVRCYKIATPLNFWLRLDHLNPLFVEKQLPPEIVNLDPQQLCVPVYKNNLVPPPDVQWFLRYVDWRCHQISGPSLDLPLKLDHLNPVIAQMFGPTDLVIVREPQQLCVPVAKDNVFPPPDVLRLVQWLDVKCYRIDSDRHLGGEPIWLTHLNPLLAGGPAELTYFEGPAPHQLCVPVAKNGNYPPPDVRPIIEYSDVLCYRLRGDPLNRPITLTHLNPVLAGIPPETVRVTDTEKLCVPVAKEGRFPPDWTTTTIPPN
jgi:hypothetical protein